jgi:hypothetical protein
MRTLALIALLLTAATPASAAPAYSPEDQRACQDDAFRLCNHAVPDEQKVKACFMANFRKLSPGCRRVFQRGRHR